MEFPPKESTFGMQPVSRLGPSLVEMQLALLKAVYGIPNARSNEFADLSSPTVAATPSCAATRVVAQWSLRRPEPGNILFWLQKPSFTA